MKSIENIKGFEIFFFNVGAQHSVVYGGGGKNISCAFMLNICKIMY